MIRVIMTTNIDERPPKVMGLLTMRQLVCIGLAALAILPIILWTPLPFAGKFVTCLLIIFPFIFIGWYPPGVTNPVIIAWDYIKTLRRGAERHHECRADFFLSEDQGETK